jgi:hypothetical protein
VTTVTAAEYIVLWQGLEGAILGNARGACTAVDRATLDDTHILEQQSPTLSIIVTECSRVEGAYLVDSPEPWKPPAYLEWPQDMNIGKDATDIKPITAVFKPAGCAVTILCGYLEHLRIWCIKGQPQYSAYPE